MARDTKPKNAARLAYALGYGQGHSINEGFLVEFCVWYAEHTTCDATVPELQEKVTGELEKVMVEMVRLDHDSARMSVDKALRELDDLLSRLAWEKIFTWLAARLHLPVEVCTRNIPFNREYQYGNQHLQVRTTYPASDTSQEAYTADVLLRMVTGKLEWRQPTFSLYVGRVIGTNGQMEWEHMLDRDDLNLMTGVVHKLAPGHENDPDRFYPGATALWES